MKLTIKDRTEQKLLSRERIKAELAFEGPIPSRADIFNELSAKASVKPELLVVYKIISNYGSRLAKVIAFAYKNKADLDRIEETKKLKRTGFKVPAPKEEAKPAEAPKEEVKPSPAEEKKEEKKPEVKAE